MINNFNRRGERGYEAARPKVHAVLCDLYNDHPEGLDEAFKVADPQTKQQIYNEWKLKAGQGTKPELYAEVIKQAKIICGLSYAVYGKDIEGNFERLYARGTRRLDTYISQCIIQRVQGRSGRGASKTSRPKTGGMA